MSFLIVLHHFQGAVVRYFMAYCGTIAIMPELSENYGAIVNVNVVLQPHSSTYTAVSLCSFAVLQVISIFRVEQSADLNPELRSKQVQSEESVKLVHGHSTVARVYQANGANGARHQLRETACL